MIEERRRSGPQVKPPVPQVPGPVSQVKPSTLRCRPYLGSKPN